MSENWFNCEVLRLEEKVDPNRGEGGGSKTTTNNNKSNNVGHHPSKSSTMIFITFLCQILILDTWTRTTAAFPQDDSSSSLHPFNPTHPLSHTPNANSDRKGVVTLKDSSFSVSSVPSIITITSPIRDQPSGEIKPFRRKRSPDPQQRTKEWLFPPSSPSRRPYSSYGLAYRSILPISNSNSHYTGLYRNRNLFSNGANNGNNEEYNYNYNGNDHSYQNHKKNDKPLVPTSASKTTTTTMESRTKSAPATEAGSISSTLEMNGDYAGVASRDAIGEVGFNQEAPPPSKVSKGRQAKIHKENEEQEDSEVIIFPGNVSNRQQAKRHGSVRPGKATQQDSDNYVPPPLRTLDKAAIESLRMLLETRRKSSVNSRNNNSKFGQRDNNASNNKNPASSPLDIRGRPKCATDNNNGYCEEIDSYPKDFLDRVLKNSLTIAPEVFQEVFGDNIDNKTVASDLAARDGLNLQLDSPLCNSIEHTIYPKVAENKDGKFMYIVNHDEFIQGVRVEKCVKENSPCMYLEGSLTGYQSTCRQKYIYRKLLAFTRDGKATTDTFRLPACCVCHVRSVFVDDRINTAGFSGSGAENDYSPAPIVSSKDGESDNTPILQDDTNATFVENLPDKYFENVSATEILHEETLAFPTLLPQGTQVNTNRSEPNLVEAEEGGVTSDPLIGDRMMFT